MPAAWRPAIVVLATPTLFITLPPLIWPHVLSFVVPFFVFILAFFFFVVVVVVVNVEAKQRGARAPNQRKARKATSQVHGVQSERVLFV